MNVTSGHNSFRVSLARAIFLLRSGRFRDFFSAFTRKLKTFDAPDENEQYQKWIVKNEPDNTTLAEIRDWCVSLKDPPLVTFVIRNASDPALIHRTLESIRHQLFERWEVLIQTTDSAALSKIDFNDRIRHVQKDIQNAPTGKWIAPLSEGDTLAPFAVAEAMRKIENSHLDLIYSDHDVINEAGARLEPYFKPDWAPEYLQNSPYIGRLAIYNLDLIASSPTFWNDEQAWLVELSRKEIKAVRIPKVLYHFHTKPSYSSSKPNASLNKTSVSILIPTRDQPVKLRCAVNSILEKTTFPNFEIVIINNGSSEPDTLKYFEECSRDSRVRVINYDHVFNFSAINNFAVSKTTSDHIVFLNDDTEVITPGWLQEMLFYSCRIEIGAVGAKLLYRDKTIQHGGILVGLPEITVHAHHRWAAESDGYRGRLKSVQNFSAVTAACMMIRRNLFLEADGFDENLGLAYNDVDLCLRLRDRGCRNVWTPHAELFHDESASRGYETTLERQKRFSSETDYFLKRWNKQLEAGDSYYNPNLTLQNGAFRIRT